MMPGSTAAVFSVLPSSRRAVATAPSAPDLFQACFQGRLLQHLQREDGSPVARPECRGRVTPGELSWQATAGGRLSGRPGNRRPLLLCWQSPGEAVIPPELLPELARRLMGAGAPPEWVQEFLAQPQVQEQGVTLNELKEFLGKVAAEWKLKLAGGIPETAPGTDPAKLAELAELLAASPGGGVKVPPERRPEAHMLLQAAGLTPAQAAKLLWHPGAAETGLTPDLVRSQWLKSRNPELMEKPAPGLDGTGTWRQLWDRLRLPPEAWPELKAALQHLGIPPEELAPLEERASQGLPVTQVWRLLQDRQGKGAGAETPEELARELADHLDQNPVAAAETWSRLLRQAGLTEEQVASRWGRASPGTAQELRDRLVKLAPESAPPPAQETPKPLYLPARLRVSSLPHRFEGKHSPPDRDAGAPVFSGHQTSLPARGGEASPFPLAVQESIPPPAGHGGSWALTPPALRQAVWSQIENAVLQHLQPGRTQVSLSLNPPELGRVELTLSLQGERLVVQALVSRPEVAELARTQVEHLIQALARQGLTLSQFQVHVPPASQPAGAAPFAGDRPGFRRPEEGPTGRGTPRLHRPRGVDFFA